MVEFVFSKQPIFNPEVTRIKSEVIDASGELLGYQWEDLISRKEEGTGWRLNNRGREVALRWQETLVEEGKSHQEIVRDVSSLFQKIGEAQAGAKTPDITALKRVCLSVINRTRYDAALALVEEAIGEKLVDVQRSAAMVSQKVKALKPLREKEESFYGLADDEWIKATELIITERLEEEENRNLEITAKALGLVGETRGLQQIVKRFSQRLTQAFRQLFSKRTLKRATIITLITASTLGVLRTSGSPFPPEKIIQQVELIPKTLSQEAGPIEEIIVPAKEEIESIKEKETKVQLELGEPLSDIETPEDYLSIVKDHKAELQVSPERVVKPAIKKEEKKRFEMERGISLTKDVLKAEEKQVETAKSQPEIERGERREGEIPESERNVLPGAEVKYLPPESYTWKGEIEMIRPKEIVIHWDAQENTDRRSTYTTFNGLVGRTASGDPVSTHFSVGPGGSQNGPAILQMLPVSENFVQRSILSDGPSDAINIETTGRYFDDQPPPEQQTQNLVNLLVMLMEKYNLKLANITGHLERSPDIGKIDPGQAYLNMVRAKLLNTLIEQKKWNLIGGPEDWYFYKLARKNDGGLTEVSTQERESLLALLPREICQLIADRFGLVV